YLAGPGGVTETRRVATAGCDLSRGAARRELLTHLQPPFFRTDAYLTRQADIEVWLNDGKAAIVVVIPPDFQRDVDGGRQSQVQVLTDGAIAIQATVSVAYINAIAAAYSASA